MFEVVTPKVAIDALEKKQLDFWRERDILPA